MSVEFIKSVMSFYCHGKLFYCFLFMEIDNSKNYSSSFHFMPNAFSLNTIFCYYSNWRSWRGFHSCVQRIKTFILKLTWLSYYINKVLQSYRMEHVAHNSVISSGFFFLQNNQNHYPNSKRNTIYSVSIKSICHSVWWAEWSQGALTNWCSFVLISIVIFYNPITI